jgi:hypothetical protein
MRTGRIRGQPEEVLDLKISERPGSFRYTDRETLVANGWWRLLGPRYEDAGFQARASEHEK